MRNPKNIVPAAKIRVNGGSLKPDLTVYFYHDSARSNEMSIVIRGSKENDSISMEIGALPLKQIVGMTPLDTQAIVEVMGGEMAYQKDMADSVRESVILLILMTKLVCVEFDLTPETPLCKVRFDGIEGEFNTHEYRSFPSSKEARNFEDYFEATLAPAMA